MSGTLKMRGSVASHMLQFGSGQVVTKIVADISTRRRNVDVAAVSNAQVFTRYLESCALT